MGFKIGNKVNVGRIQSPETRKKMSLTKLKNKGKKTRGFGKVLSEEHKIKIGLGNKGKFISNEFKEKMRAINTGRKVSNKTKEKLKLIAKIRRDSHIGEWKTTINQRTRSSLEYKYWRKECLKRDKFTCQKTGKSGGELRVHHINNFADFPELRLIINNGITLSKESHEEFHKIYGKRNNTKEQLEDFLGHSL